jgi:peroxiredoxin
MIARERAVGIGDPVPDVPLQTADGAEFRLSSLRGRPLLVVCVRYYG